MLGRFVHTLNLFCKDHYAMEYAVEDYWIYEFAKVSAISARVCDSAMQYTRVRWEYSQALAEFLLLLYAVQIWKCSPERSNQIVHAFFKSPHFKDGIPVIPGE